MSSTASDMSNKFSWDLYQNLAAAGNLMYSPISIHTALMMTYHGARGDTREQMAKVLHVPPELGDDSEVTEAYQSLLHSLTVTDPSNTDVTLHQANRLYVQQGYAIVDTFTHTLQRVYDAQLGLVDFMADSAGARAEINKWVEEQTRDKIRELLPPDSIDSLVRAVIVNAIYFKGFWMKQFNPDETSTMPFKSNREKSVDVRMMSQKGKFKLSSDDKLKVRAVELPYVKNQLSLVIILPDDLSGDGLAAVEAQLSSSKLNSLVANTRLHDNVKVMIPRFKLEQSVSLPQVLQSMGITDLFGRGKCDLSGVSEANELVVSEVIHKAYVDVNEEGSEAAAATAVVMMKRSAMISPPSPPPFVADRPFVFFIRDNKTGALLFMGRVVEPTPAAAGRDEL